MAAEKVKTTESSEQKSIEDLEAELVRLDLRKTRIDQQITDLKADRILVTNELNRAQQELEKRRRKEAQGKSEPTVSSHALLRYIERVLEINVKMLESHILSPTNRAAIAAGATKIKANGITLVVRDNVIVTVQE